MNHTTIWTRSVRALLTWCLALAAFGIARGATYYVATTGNDSNSGAQSAPFRHLSKAAAAAQQPGDTVIVMDGTYDNEGVVAPNYVVTLYYNGTAANPITFKAQNRGGVILDSMNTSTTTSCNGASAYFNLRNAAYVVIQGFVIQRGCDSGIQSNDSAHDITFRWNEIRNIANHTVSDQIGRDGIYLNATEYNFTFDGNVFHDIGRTSGQTLLHFDHGIYSHADNVTIINNIFYNMNRGWSIQLADGASNWLIANNTFAFGNANGESGQIMFWGSNTSITVRNNVFYLPNSYAMTRYAATVSCTFDHNMIYGVTGVMSDGTGCSVGTNQIGANPTFVNASSAPYDFHLQSGSPAIDSGMTLAAVPTDIDGIVRPQGTALDLGAREYVSSVISNPPVISGVFASAISSNSAVINWSTDKPTTSSVQYGLSAYTNTTPEDPTLVTLHSAALSSLTASTLYHYRAASQDSAGNIAYSPDYTFTTAAPPITPTTFTLSAAAPSLSVGQGGSAADGITATLVSGNATAVSFTTSALPAGVTASFSSVSCTVTCTTTLTLTASATATTGSSNVVITGTGSGTSASTTLALTITATSPGLRPSAHWKMDEGRGTTAADASGNGNTGSLTNAAWASGSYGTSVALSGKQSYVAVKESSSIEMSKQLTVAFWIYGTSNANIDPRVITKLYSWDVKLNTSSRHPQFSAGGKYAMMNSSLPVNTWQHVVFTFSSGVLKGYVNGAPVAFSTNTFTGTETLPLQMYGLFIGTDPSKTASFKGNVDDIRLYNQALSASDVLALYAGTLH